MGERCRYDDADMTYLVACCFEHNVAKWTRRYAPQGFDLTTLPGKGWQHWDGGKHLEVIK